jgi:hypothetical protein
VSRGIAVTGIDCDLVLIAPPIDLKLLTANDKTHQRISGRLPQEGDDLRKAVELAAGGVRRMADCLRGISRRRRHLLHLCLKVKVVSSLRFRGNAALYWFSGDACFWPNTAVVA